MDYTKIPHFALFRQAGTVIVRVIMDVKERCCEPGTSPRSGYPRILHRPSSCAQCYRTRSNSQYSDCDSVFVDRSRPYRSSSARSRYVNVCAAVCLVLLVGGLSPQSSAAPHKRTMDRQRRATNQEEKLWGNPCDYVPNSESPTYSAKKAEAVAKQADNTFKSTAMYKDKIAQLHSYQKFEEVLPLWSSMDWLKNFTWFPEEGLPKDKVLFQKMPEAYVDNLMGKIDEVLPSMYKGLKMVVAGLYSIIKESQNDRVNLNEGVITNFKQTMHDVRAVLCLFDELLRSRNLEIMPLYDSEVPDFKRSDKMSYVVLVYRDTLNYLEYLVQVFLKIYDVHSKNGA